MPEQFGFAIASLRNNPLVVESATVFPVRLFVPEPLLDRFPPDQDGLFAHMCDLVAPEMLQEIAESDYGIFAEECLEVLQTMVSARQTPEVPGFYGREMLELTRWSDPESIPGHITRAFCCAAMLRVDSIRGWDPGQADSNIVRLTESVRAIGDAASEAAARFITFELGRTDARFEDYGCLALCLGCLGLCQLGAGSEMAKVIDEWMILIEDLAPIKDEEFPHHHFTMSREAWLAQVDELARRFPLPGILERVTWAKVKLGLS